MPKSTPSPPPARSRASGGRALPAKRQLFVEAYLGVAHGNKTEAARLAGYAKPKQQGHRLLTFVDVAAAVGERLATAKKCMSADEVLAELTDVAAAPWRDFCDVTLGEDGETLTVKMRLADKLKALELLGKNHKLFVDRIERSSEETSAEQAKADALQAVADAMERVSLRKQAPA